MLLLQIFCYRSSCPSTCHLYAIDVDLLLQVFMPKYMSSLCHCCRSSVIGLHAQVHVIFMPLLQIFCYRSSCPSTCHLYAIVVDLLLQVFMPKYMSSLCHCCRSSVIGLHAQVHVIFMPLLQIFCYRSSCPSTCHLYAIVVDILLQVFMPKYMSSLCHCCRSSVIGLHAQVHVIFMPLLQIFCYRSSCPSTCHLYAIVVDLLLWVFMPKYMSSICHCCRSSVMGLHAQVHVIYMPLLQIFCYGSSCPSTCHLYAIVVDLLLQVFMPKYMSSLCHCCRSSVIGLHAQVHVIYMPLLQIFCYGSSCPSTCHLYAIVVDLLLWVFMPKYMSSLCHCCRSSVMGLHAQVHVIFMPLLQIFCYRSSCPSTCHLYAIVVDLLLQVFMPKYMSSLCRCCRSSVIVLHAQVHVIFMPLLQIFCYRSSCPSTCHLYAVVVDLLLQVFMPKYMSSLCHCCRSSVIGLHAQVHVIFMPLLQIFCYRSSCPSTCHLYAVDVDLLLQVFMPKYMSSLCHCCRSSVIGLHAQVHVIFMPLLQIFCYRSSCPSTCHLYAIDVDLLLQVFMPKYMSSLCHCCRSSVIGLHAQVHVIFMPLLQIFCYRSSCPSTCHLYAIVVDLLLQVFMPKSVHVIFMPLLQILCYRSSCPSTCHLYAIVVDLLLQVFMPKSVHVIFMQLLQIFCYRSSCPSQYMSSICHCCRSSVIGLHAQVHVIFMPLLQIFCYRSSCPSTCHLYAIVVDLLLWVFMPKYMSSICHCCRSSVMGLHAQVHVIFMPLLQIFCYGSSCPSTCHLYAIVVDLLLQVFMPKYMSSLCHCCRSSVIGLHAQVHVIFMPLLQIFCYRSSCPSTCHLYAIVVDLLLQVFMPKYMSSLCRCCRSSVIVLHAQVHVIFMPLLQIFCYRSSCPSTCHLYAVVVDPLLQFFMPKYMSSLCHCCRYSVIGLHAQVHVIFMPLLQIFCYRSSCPSTCHLYAIVVDLLLQVFMPKYMSSLCHCCRSSVIGLHAQVHVIFMPLLQIFCYRSSCPSTCHLYAIVVDLLLQVFMPKYMSSICHCCRSSVIGLHAQVHVIFMPLLQILCYSSSCPSQYMSSLCRCCRSSVIGLHAQVHVIFMPLLQIFCYRSSCPSTCHLYAIVVDLLLWVFMPKYMSSICHCCRSSVMGLHAQVHVIFMPLLQIFCYRSSMPKYMSSICHCCRSSVIGLHAQVHVIFMPLLQIVKPRYAHHCRLCNCCFHEMDHHCLLLNKCVGRGTQRLFVLFLLICAVNMVTFVMLSTWYLYTEFSIFIVDARDIVVAIFNYYVFVWTMLLGNAVSLGWCMGMLMTQMWMISNGYLIATMSNVHTKLTYRQCINNLIAFALGNRVERNAYEAWPGKPYGIAPV